MHLEEEIDINEDDMIRFASYNLRLYKQYHKKINTVILSIKHLRTENIITTGDIIYKPHIIEMSGKNGEEKLKEIKEKIKKKEPINEIELIFLPLMKTSQEKTEILKEVIEIEKQLEYNEKQKEKIMALTLVLCDKLVKREEIEEIEEIK